MDLLARLSIKRSRGAGLALLTTLGACAVEYGSDELAAPPAPPPSPSVGEVGASKPPVPSETGGSSGTDGAGGRPRCVFSGDALAAEDAITTLGDLAQTRAALERALSNAGPVSITWHEQLGGVTELSLELVRWDERAQIDPSEKDCILVSGEFHLFSADGLIDANIVGGFSDDGFQADIELDAASCEPLPRLCELLGARRRIELRAAGHGTTLRWSSAVRVFIASGAGLAVPAVWLGETAPIFVTQIVPRESLPLTDPVPPPVVVPPPAPPQPGSCTDLEVGGPSVLTLFESGAPPDAGQGGTIVDGVYDLTSTTIYRSAPTSQRFYTRETIRISQQGTYLEMINEATSGGSTLAETIAPEGAALNPVTTCPLGESRSFGPNYTATPGHFSLVNGLYVKNYALRSDP